MSNLKTLATATLLAVSCVVSAQQPYPVANYPLSTQEYQQRTNTGPTYQQRQYEYRNDYRHNHSYNHAHHDQRVSGRDVLAAAFIIGALIAVDRNTTPAPVIVQQPIIVAPPLPPVYRSSDPSYSPLFQLVNQYDSYCQCIRQQWVQIR